MKKLFLILLLSNLTASPQEWLRDKLELDGYSVLHYAGGNLFTRVLSSNTINSWFNSEPPSNTSILVALGVITIGWEMWQYDNYGGYDEWINVYGSKRRAFINAGVDIGLGMLGGLVSLRYGSWIPKKHKHKEKTNEINYNPVRRTVVFTIRL